MNKQAAATTTSPPGTIRDSAGCKLAKRILYLNFSRAASWFFQTFIATLIIISYILVLLYKRTKYTRHRLAIYIRIAYSEYIIEFNIFSPQVFFVYTAAYHRSTIKRKALESVIFRGFASAIESRVEKLNESRPRADKTRRVCPPVYITYTP